MAGTAAVAMFLLAIARNLLGNITDFGKRTIVAGIITALIDAAIAFALTYIFDDHFSVFWIFCFLFLLYGCIQMAVMHTKFISLKLENRYKALGGEMLFTLAVILLIVVLFSVLEYFFPKDKNIDFMFYPILLSFLMFLVPLFVYHTFEAAYSIPKAVFKTWEYPVTQPIDPPDENSNERLLVIGFDIPKKAADIKKTFFRAKTPETIVVGELFYHFINDYNELQSETPIQFINEHKEPITWWFRLKKRWYQSNKVLDPYLTVRENGIKENSVIICEHI